MVSGCKFRFVCLGLLFGIGLVMMLNGCAALVPRVENDAAALRQVDRWSQANAGIKQFKGLMQVQIRVPDRNISGRAAFAAATPGCLRLEFLNPIGQPLFRLASDSRTISVISAQDHRVQHFKQTRNALAHLIGVPLSIEDLVDVLVGRPPLPHYAAAQSPAEGQPCEVTLKSKWNVLLADLRSRTCDRISSMQAYDRQGKLQYTIRWVQWHAVQGHVLPRQVQISSTGGVLINLSIERLWPDVSIAPSTFVLKDPTDR